LGVGKVSMLISAILFDSSDSVAATYPVGIVR